MPPSTGAAATVGSRTGHVLGSGGSSIELRLNCRPVAAAAAAAKVTVHYRTQRNLFRSAGREGINLLAEQRIVTVAILAVLVALYCVFLASNDIDDNVVAGVVLFELGVIVVVALIIFVVFIIRVLEEVRIEETVLLPLVRIVQLTNTTTATKTDASAATAAVG